MQWDERARRATPTTLPMPHGRPEVLGAAAWCNVSGAQAIARDSRGDHGRRLSPPVGDSAEACSGGAASSIRAKAPSAASSASSAAAQPRGGALRGVVQREGQQLAGVLRRSPLRPRQPAPPVYQDSGARRQPDPPTDPLRSRLAAPPVQLYASCTAVWHDSGGGRHQDLPVPDVISAMTAVALRGDATRVITGSAACVVEQCSFENLVMPGPRATEWP